MIQANTKRCSACRTFKPLSAFYTYRKAGGTYHRSQCKDCARKSSARHWRDKNQPPPDESKAAMLSELHDREIKRERRLLPEHTQDRIARNVEAYAAVIEAGGRLFDDSQSSDVKA